MKKFSLLLAFLGFLGLQVVFAQTREISGLVTSSEDGSSIPGASVVVTGTTLGTITDMDGKFTLKVPENASALTVSFVGMKSLQVPITSQSTYTIKLEPENIAVDEVVVTALGISREKKALGYAVQEVGGDALSETKNDNVVSALSGKVAGVQVSGSSGNMGGSSRILIRGASSVTGNNEPLFVVDGVPMDNSNFNSVDAARGAGGIDYGNMAQDINPDDIQNISVLKGPSAAALYGSRAANGVIMITTKKGKARKGVGVTVNSGVSFEQVSLLPRYQRDYGGGYGDFSTVNINGTDYQVPAFDIDESWGPKFDGQMVLQWDAFDEWDTANYLKPREWKAPAHDVKDFFDTGVAYNNNVSFSGGDEDRSFRLSITSVNSDGYMPNSSLDRYTIAFNGSTKLGKKVTASAGINYVSNSAVGRPVTGYDDNNIMQKFTQWGQRQLDMERLKNYKNPDGSQRVWNRTAWDDPTPLYSDNPYWTRYENFNEDSRDRFFGNVGLVWNITDYLSASAKANKDYYVFRTQDRVAIGSQALSSYKEVVRNSSEDNYEFMLNFNKDIATDLNLSAMFGGNYRQNDYYRNTMETQGGLVLPGLFTATNSKDAPKIEDYETHKKVSSLYGSFSLGWKNTLYLDGTFRNDWSSTLPKDNWSYFYPSVTGSFVFSELPAIKSANWLSFGKLRAGWAMVGNDTDPYNLQEAYTNYLPNFGGVPRYSTPNTMPNSKLKPETTYSWEVGGEFRFFHDRLGLDVTYYSMETQDLITNVAISGSSGYLYKTVNAGTMTNKGVEVMAYGTPVKTRNFKWDITVNFAKNENKLTKLLPGVDNYRLANGPFKVTVNAFVGAAYGALMGTNYVLDDANNKLVSTSGRYRKTSDVQVLGSVMPDYNMGITNAFKFKNFDASALIDIQHGGQYFSTSYMWGMYSGMLHETVWQNGVDIRENGITLDGVYGYLDNDGNVVYTDADGNVSSTPVKNTTAISAPRYGADYYSGPDAQEVFDASYIKLREVTLGYTFPSKLTGPIKNLRLSAFGRNLAIWGLDNPYFDPESAVTTSGNVQGIEGAALPATRTYGVNVKFNF